MITFNRAWTSLAVAVGATLAVTMGATAQVVCNTCDRTLAGVRQYKVDYIARVCDATDAGTDPADALDGLVDPDCPLMDFRSLFYPELAIFGELYGHRLNTDPFDIAYYGITDLLRDDAVVRQQSANTPQSERSLPQTPATRSLRKSI
ncbi:MAG: hypothetical protein ACREJO_11435 [Phycisphaerales bacterium]